MNKKIKELALEARLGATLLLHHWGSVEALTDSEQNDLVQIEKFAQLIVRECSKVVVNGGYRNPALSEKHPLTPPEIARMIQEHFGAEQ